MSNNDPFTIFNNFNQELNYDQEAVFKTIEGLIKSSPVFVFMKGNPDMPQCGFSANTCAILTHCDIEFKSYNVLEDPNIRQGIKDFTKWPTIPQIFINGEFIGGNDILTELFEAGELQKIFEK